MRIQELFAGWDSVMVRACLQGSMGRIRTWGGDSAAACLGDFCFLAGRPVRELVEQADAPILVPGNEGWLRQIEQTLGERAVSFTRYAARYEPEAFGRDKLIRFTNSVPHGFSLRPIEKGMCFTLMREEWSRDLCGCFRDEADFLKRGLGFVIMQDGTLPVAGAASYAVCEGAIEIEIDTRPEFRRLGLAKACGAMLILECLRRGLYPSWDAHDCRSLSLAEQLGYRLDHPYPACWAEDKVRDKQNRNRQTFT